MSLRRPWTLPAACAVVAMLLHLTGCATTGALRGTLRMPHAATGRAIGGQVPRATRLSDAVVYLEPESSLVERLARASAPSESARVARPRASVRMAARAFVPYVGSVARGTIVTFSNRDRIYHNVFSVSPARHFDLGKLAPGQSRSVRFDTTGVVQLFSELDPDMTGFVFVTPGRAFARPDATGAFTFPRLPKGHYVVRVWHPVFGRASKPVDLEDKTASVAIEW